MAPVKMVGWNSSCVEDKCISTALTLRFQLGSFYCRLSDFRTHFYPCPPPTLTVSNQSVIHFHFYIGALLNSVQKFSSSLLWLDCANWGGKLNLN